MLYGYVLVICIIEMGWSVSKWSIFFLPTLILTTQNVILVQHASSSELARNTESQASPSPPDSEPEQDPQTTHVHTDVWEALSY